jgi:predicted nucleic acid-binding protein
MLRAVMDTSVLVAGLRSRAGASHELLRLLREGRWALVLSNTVASEYHEILHREAAVLNLTHAEVDKFLDGLCALAEQRKLVTEWQPAATDPDDEAIVQLAREAGTSYLVTHNVRHVAGAEAFGVRVVRPAELLTTLRQQL